MKKTGFFITFEGIEGSGKSTHTKLLADFLCNAGYEVVQIREPGSTKIGESIRKLVKHQGKNYKLSPYTEALLFAAARAQLVNEVILPALSAGKIVISDRFVDSSLAYQGYGRQLGVDNILTLNMFAVSIIMSHRREKYLLPTLTFLLDLPAEEALQRISKRYSTKKKSSPGQDMDRFEMENLQFHQRVRNGYLMLARKWKKRYCIVDATMDVNTNARIIYEKAISCLKREV